MEQQQQGSLSRFLWQPAGVAGGVIAAGAVKSVHVATTNLWCQLACAEPATGQDTGAATPIVTIAAQTCCFNT